METWLELHGVDEESVVRIRAEQITAMLSTATGGTVVYVPGFAAEVTEAPEMIIERIVHAATEAGTTVPETPGLGN